MRLKIFHTAVERTEMIVTRKLIFIFLLACETKVFVMSGVKNMLDDASFSLTVLDTSSVCIVCQSV